MIFPAWKQFRRVLALAALVASATAVPASAGTQTTAELQAKSDLLVKINAARTSRGIPALTLSRVLGVPAVRHSRYLARTGELDHNGADGRPFYVRLYAAGFSRRKAVGENLGLIAGCSTDAAAVMVKMWLASPGHRRNLLSKNFKVVGLAVVQSPACAPTIYTTDFGG